MEKIIFDDLTYVWKKKLDLIKYKSEFIENTNQIIDTIKNKIKKTDGFSYNSNVDKNQLHNFSGEIDRKGNIKIKSQLDNVLQISIDACKEIYKSENKLITKDTEILVESWVNIVRSKNPVQPIYDEKEENNKILKYHNHRDLNLKKNRFIPMFTLVYYIQMPDIMIGDDGVLYFLGKNGQEYWIRPECDDLIIMLGHTPHAPKNAPMANLDRIVLAANIGFENRKIIKSVI